MAGRGGWWHGILARSLLAVLAVSLLVGAVSTYSVSLVIGARTHAQALTKQGELLDTVASTASVACFVGDEQLGKEVAQGLLRNSEVQRVVIRVGERELAIAERVPRKIGADDAASAVANPPAVSRVLRSPFK